MMESPPHLCDTKICIGRMHVITPKRKALFGHLECIAAPQLDEIDCGMEDIKTLTSFKEKIRKDMAMAMKFTLGSK